MAFKMKGSTHYGKGNSAAKMYGKPSPAKDYSVDKGSHDHPHGDSPNKFLGGMMKKLGGAAKGMLKGKDGKFGIGDVGRLAMGPLGAAAGATGLFMKEDKEEKNQFGETPAEYKKRMVEMGLRSPDKKKPIKKAVKGASKEAASEALMPLSKASAEEKKKLNKRLGSSAKKSPTKIIGTIKKGVKKVSDKYKAYEKKKTRESMARAANASAGTKSTR